MLAYLFLSEVATQTQSNSLSAIFPCVHVCLTTGQEHWHRIFSGKAAFAGISVFTGIYTLFAHL